MIWTGVLWGAVVLFGVGMMVFTYGTDTPSRKARITGSVILVLTVVLALLGIWLGVFGL